MLIIFDKNIHAYLMTGDKTPQGRNDSYHSPSKPALHETKIINGNFISS